MSRYNNIIEEIKKYKCKTFLEVGTCQGDTALNMIKAAILDNNTQDIYYYGFDLFELLTSELHYKERAKYPLKEYQVLEKLQKTNANITLFKGFSKETIPVSDIKTPIDLIFLDGGHSLETVSTDWKNLQRYITPKTIVLFDDYLSDFKRLNWGCNNIIDNLDTTKYIITTFGPDNCPIEGKSCDIFIKKVMIK